MISDANPEDLSTPKPRLLDQVRDKAQRCMGLIQTNLSGAAIDTRLTTQNSPYQAQPAIFPPEVRHNGHWFFSG